MAGLPHMLHRAHRANDFDDLSITAGTLADYVDTRRGSNSDSGYSHGNTFPGATVPNGFNFWTPVTNGNPARPATSSPTTPR
nr:hypothetical protein GCM10020063_070720 [Dactylosporangium thailandense]